MTDVIEHVYKNNRKLCIHHKRSYYCKECGGVGICAHGKIKNNCKECHGTQICDHGKQKRTCKECDGSGLCEHKKNKRLCKDCGGAGLCEHKKNKLLCKDCGGAGLCDHGKVKCRCKECRGASICPHNKRTSTCKDCGGTSICIHGAHKTHCKDCGGSALCKSHWCHTRGIRKYDGYCLPCTIHLHPEISVSRNYKTKETAVCNFIKETFPTVTCIADKKVIDGCSQRRPDILIDVGSHVIIVEIDENQHTPYDTSCENRRMMELSQDVGHRPIVFIRFNPDTYTVDDMKHSSCWRVGKDGILRILQTKAAEWASRLTVLKDTIQHWIDTPSKKTIEVAHLFYDKS